MTGQIATTTRGISLLSVARQVLAHVMLTRLTDYAADIGIFPESQCEEEDLGSVLNLGCFPRLFPDLPETKPRFLVCPQLHTDQRFREYAVQWHSNLPHK